MSYCITYKFLNIIYCSNRAKANGAKGFVLWDLAASIFILAITSIFIGNWYCNLVRVNCNGINRLKAINIASSSIEKLISDCSVIPKDFNQDIFSVNYKHVKILNNQVNLFTVSVLWQEKWQANTKKFSVELSTGISI